MAVDVNATRRQRAWDSIQDGASRTWSRNIRGSAYELTLSRPQIRSLFGSLVFSVDVLAKRDGVVFYDDRLNSPNPPTTVRDDAGVVTDSPRQAFRDHVIDAVRAATDNFTKPHLMRDAEGDLLGDTLAVRAGTADGSINSSNASWNTTRNGGTFVVNTTSTTHTIRANPSYDIRHYWGGFDTSSLGAGATISTSVFTLYGTGTAETVTDGTPVIQVRPASWGGSLTSADWIDINPESNWTGITLMASMNLSSWNQTNNAANNLTHASSADISKTGTTEVTIGLSTSAGASAPTGDNQFVMYSADVSGTSSDPLLTVTYTPAISGTIAATLQKAVFSGSGAQTQTGTITATLRRATAALTGGQTFTGSAAMTMQAATFAGTGSQGAGAEGAIAATMQAATASFTGAMQPSGTVAATLQKATFTGAAAQVVAGAIVAELQKATFSGSGTQTIAGTIAAALTKALFSGAGAQTQTGTITATLQEPTATLVGVMQPSGTIVSTLAYPLFSGTATAGNTTMAYSLYIDLDGTPLLSDDTDVAGDVIGEGRGVGNVAVHIERGHDVTRVLSPPVAGLARFTLDNVDGTYDVGTDLRAGLFTRISASYLNNTYPLFAGVLDQPTRSQPDVRLPYVTVDVLGRLARLSGINVNTGLYADITTSEAFNYTLDAAGFAKNFAGYIDDLGHAGGWNLDGLTGDDADTSGNGNDAVITLGSGVRGDTAIEDGGTLTTDFDGAATRYTVADDAAIQNLFATGGLLMALFNVDTVGEASQGTIVSKEKWRLYTYDQSGSTMKLRWFYDWGTTDGVWETTNRVVTVGNDYFGAVYYDRTSTSTNPTIWLCDITNQTVTKLTVGSGLTETSTPAGSAQSDVTSPLVIGSDNGATVTFDGNIGCVRIFGDLGDETYWEPFVNEAASRAFNAARHIDDGLTTMDWWWLDNEDALQALETLKNTEGPGAALYEDPTGAIVFKNRHSRSTEARSTTVQTTFTDSTEPRPSSPLTYDPGLKDVVNICEVEVARRTAQAVGEVWALGETVVIAAGQTKTFTARASNPFQNAVTPSSGGGDYTVSSGSLTTVSLDRTSGAQVTISLYSATGCTITGLRLRAESVEVVNSTVVSNSLDTSTSQTNYGASTYRLPTRKEIDSNTGVDFANAIVSFYQNGLPTVQMTVESNFAEERKEAVLEREVGDRVHLTIGNDIDEDMYVEHVTHDIHTSGIHNSIFSLAAAGEVVSYFVVGTSQLGGTDVLAF